MLAIVGGRVETVENGAIERGTVLVDEASGVIVAVGDADLPVPSDAAVIDASGRYVFPGFIDSHTHLGVYADGDGWAGEDGNEMTDPVTPAVRASDGFYTDDPALADALAHGVTAAWVTPGSGNAIGGLGFTVKLAGRRLPDMVLKDPSGLKAAFGENPKRVYGREKKFPMTRLGIAKAIREAFVQAEEYREKRRRNPPATERNLNLEALTLVLDGVIPLRTHAHRADDILVAMRIAHEFGVRQVVEHGTEAFKLVDELLRAGTPVSCGPGLVARVKVEVRERSFRTPGILARAGVKVSIVTDHPVVPVHYLPVSAALAVREGMEEADAIRAITLNAAEICEVGDRLGSIVPGKDADLVIWSGHPFEFRSTVEKTLVRGRVVYDRERAEDTAG